MKAIGTLLVVLSLLFIFQSCSDNGQEPLPILDTQKTLPARWADVTLQTIRFALPNSPTYTSRSLGYIGLTMYESVVYGSTTNKSIASQLNGLASVPQPDPDKDYNWALSLNAGQSMILKSLYPHASARIVAVIDSLEMETFEAEMNSTPSDVAQRSVDFGRAVAKAIYEWSKTDGGYEGYLHHFDPTYKFPSGDAYWSPPLFGQTVSGYPLHPYWGSNRTFVADDAALPVPVITSFSTTPGTDNYKLFHEVYMKRNSLTDEEMRIAAWWADDPTQTASPPGHSYNLATIAVTSAKADLFMAAEAYAKVGMSVADAFICCWKVKYTYHSVRPFPFIKAHIDQQYQQFWPEPPFPAFSSGHATQSAATAVALTSVFGNNFPLVDNTYEKRAPDFNNIQYVSRAYKNIQATATECAYSRFLGGIHTRQDNETGAAQGTSIGENVAGLQWKK